MKTNMRPRWMTGLAMARDVLITFGLALSMVSGARAQMNCPSALATGTVQWTPQWCDEFGGASGSAIDSTHWQFDRGNLNVNNELEWYCAPGDPAPCDTSNPNAYIDGSGHLVIQALRLNAVTSPGSNAWTSARLNTGNNLANFKYGRIEANMLLPVGPGLWPAWWSLGSNIGSVGWPSSGEMDFMENVPAASGLGPSTIKSTIHGPSYSGTNGLGQNYTFPSNDPNGTDVTTLHTYGAIWSPFMVQFYVDDPNNVFFVRTASDIPVGSQWVFNNPFFVLLNLAVGGTGSWPGPPDGTTPSPARMIVDYVRVYQPSAVVPPNLGNPAPIKVNAGTPGSSTVNLGSTSGTLVYVSCTTNAPKAKCSINTGNLLNANVVDFRASASGTATVSVVTTANTAMAGSRFGFGGVRSVAAMGTAVLCFGLMLLAPGRSRSLRFRQIGLLAVLASLTATGCGGGSSTPPPPPSGGTPPGSYSVTVNAYSITSDPSNSSTFSALSIPLTVN